MEFWRKRVRQHDRRFMRFMLPVAVILLNGCLFGTDPTPVAVRINDLDLSAEARAAWPSDPVIQSDGSLIVRGKVSLSCEGLAATAERQGSGVILRLLPARPDAVCPAVVPYPHPYEIELLGLPPGSYALTIELGSQRFERDGTITAR